MKGKEERKGEFLVLEEVLFYYNLIVQLCKSRFYSFMLNSIKPTFKRGHIQF